MKLFRLATYILISMTLGCSQLRKDTTLSSPTGPSAGAPSEDADFQQLPAQLSNQSPTKVALILGGGGARTLAHAGVIRALTKEKISISHVAGVEWSSLVAASFAVSQQTHDMDWKLYKLDAMNLKFGSGFFGLSGKKSIRDLNEYFSSNFSNAKVEGAKVNFSCATQLVGSAAPRVIESGAVSEALKQCIPYPPFFEVERNVSAITSIWSLVRHLKRSGAEVIVFIDVLGPSVLRDPLISKDKETTLLWTQALEANQMAKGMIKNSFTISLDSYSIFDFSNRKNIEAAGEKAGNEIARVLKERFRL